MVYSTMRRHSADLEIDSAPGKGTTVRLSFVAATTTAAGRPGAGAAHTTSTPLRILVVDDDPLLPKSLRDTLETAGHQVVTAAGGQAGVDSFREALVGGKPFRAVITDLGMPYVDGRQVARAALVQCCEPPPAQS